MLLAERMTKGQMADVRRSLPKQFRKLFSQPKLTGIKVRQRNSSIIQ
jgi:hypothetical protein